MSDASKVNLIVKHAPKLRDAGVSRIELTEHGMLVELYPKFEAPERQQVAVEEEPDALNDAWTFGGSMPSFRRPEGEP